MLNHYSFFYKIINHKKIFERDTIFSSPVSKLRDWNFDEYIAEVFVDMLDRSIPGYSKIISMIGMLAGRVVKPNTKVYDLGCSLGSVTLSMYRQIHAKGCQIIAVDNSPAMVRCFRRNINSYRCNIPVKVIEDYIQNISIKNSSMVVLNFTLQFLPPVERQSLLNKIYKGLLPGGVMVLSEKFNFKDQILGDLLYNLHHDFKRGNGYSNLEINQKSRMLQKVMLTDSIETHKMRLKQAGFKHVEIWFQCFNFGSLLAVK